MGFINITTIGFGAFTIFLLYNLMAESRKTKVEEQRDIPGFLVPMQVGKDRNLGGSARDTTMYTQNLRRQVTVNGFWAGGQPMKETTHTTGFATGAVDVFSISDVFNP
jgi:hypothetical protein